MLYYFNHYSIEGIIPPINTFLSQAVMVKPNIRTVSVKILRYICDTRDCSEYIII
jgi:hypothetical protein